MSVSNLVRMPLRLISQAKIADINISERHEDIPLIVFFRNHQFVVPYQNGKLISLKQERQNSYPVFIFVKNEDVPKIHEYRKICHEYSTSYCEKEVLDFVKSLGQFEVLNNVRNVISPKELDIYIPSKNLAIEFDGLYFHDENHVNKNYHAEKTNLCNDKNIDLIHIYEDDWRDKKEIVKSMIRSRLGIYEEKYMARKCKIKEVDKIHAKEFLNKNHLQDYASKCNTHLGLYYDDELVQLISITNKGFHDGNTELTRMCTKLNTQVIGGFSKLIKNYCKLYNCNKLVSYVYKSWFNGNGYLSCGFEIVKNNPPSYYYILNNTRYHRSNFRKDRLQKMYEKNQLKYFDENDTESNICFKNNIYKIYDCGIIKVVYNK